MAASDETTASARLADHAITQGTQVSTAALDSNSELASEAIKQLTDLAKQGAWIFLLVVGALIYGVSFGMEVHVWGVGNGTLSTGKFGAALGAGAFVLLLGAALRLYALHQISTIQSHAAQLQKELAEGAISKIQEGTQDAIKELSRG